MPSRPFVVGILLFWLAVMAAVVNREVVPRFFGDEPPTPEFVAVDELSQANVGWTIYRGAANAPADEKVGKMTSRTEYVPADDSFRFVTTYNKMKLKERALGFEIELSVPAASTALRVGRDGKLLEQSFRGSVEADLIGGGKISGTVEAAGVVRGGMLEGSATLTAEGVLDKPYTAAFTPVPVPDGQVMNPLMPVDRLRGVVPGRRWAVRQVDPLGDALGQLMVNAFQERFSKGNGEKKPFALPPSPELLAEVLRDPVEVDRPGGTVSCWVIEYTSDNPPVFARTYVRRDDGRVLRQEATAYGGRLRFERDD